MTVKNVVNRRLVMESLHFKDVMGECVICKKTPSYIVKGKMYCKEHDPKSNDRREKSNG